MRVSMVGLLTLLCLVFAVSVAGKLRDRRTFADSLRTLLPRRWADPVAVSITLTEAVLVLGLGWALAGQFGSPPGGSAADWLPPALTVAFLAVLTLGVALAIRRGTGTRCACFGTSTRLLGVRHLIRNGFLLATALVALALAVGSAGSPVGPAAGLVSAAGGAVVALLIIRLDDLVELFLPVRS